MANIWQEVKKGGGGGTYLGLEKRGGGGTHLGFEGCREGRREGRMDEGK